MLTSTFALIGPLGPWEVGIILVLGVLIFGKRLPEVGRNVGKGFIEFKKGLAGATEEISKAQREADRLPQTATAATTPSPSAGIAGAEVNTAEQPSA